MTTYSTDIIAKVKPLCQGFSYLSKLTNQRWVCLGNEGAPKKVYVFRDNNQLLISEGGMVEKASWEYLGYTSLLLEIDEETYLLEHSFFNGSVIALRLYDTDEYVFFVSDSGFSQGLTTIRGLLEFLDSKCIEEKITQQPSLPTHNALPIVTPEYEVLETAKTRSLLNGVTKIHKIQYADGISGVIYTKSKNGTSHYKEERTGKTYVLAHHYTDFENCVNALYYCIKTGHRLNDGHIASYVKQN